MISSVDVNDDEDTDEKKNLNRVLVPRADVTKDERRRV